MAEAPVVECALREVAYRPHRAERTVTVRCAVVADGGSAEGYGTADTERLARLKAFSEAVERLLACTPFALVARPSTTRATGRDAEDGVRAVPAGARLRRYRPLGPGPEWAAPLSWSAPWVAGVELAEGVLPPAAARLSSTIGWAVAPTGEAALRGAVLELTELLDYGAFLLRSLDGPASGDSTNEGSDAPEDSGPRIVPIAHVGRTPVALAVSPRAGRLMPATGLGAAATSAEAAERALLELAQAETMWRDNPTAVEAERHFLRRFERWPLLLRCATLDFAPVGAAADGPPSSPLAELVAAGVRVWADTGVLRVSAPGTAPVRLHFAHVLSRPQPLLGLVRAGIPVFDAGEVRKILDHRAPGAGPAGRRPARRGAAR
ncbi:MULTISPECIES: hypothetical protein [Actinosynnema]|uniref:hypothetical protein n=1 Tax=Actinosynnema TaxID=40566 RepID=UPI0020A5C3DB|nr:hypothetical protein [Actinosynnema pretiosum]MCP2096665.1 Ribosomal protein S12 methylthiotransferase accessory factor YcaO [Actinosynnema pretiosum]